MANDNQLVSLNPATNQVVGAVDITSIPDIEAAVQRCRDAQRGWWQQSLASRVAVLRGVAERLEQQSNLLAALIVSEMGKVRSEATAEVLDSVRRIHYFCDNAAGFLAPRETIVGDVKGIVDYEPMGVVAAIKPWNFPVSIPIWTLVPALIAGNTAVFKPSELTPLVGQFLADLFWKAGVPHGVLEIVHGEENVGKALVSAPVDMIAFVGSQAAGSHIMRAAAPDLKRLALELGGKDPMLVLADADLESAAQAAVTGAFKNCGQVCCSVERIYVEKAAFSEFRDRVIELTKALVIGAGTNPAAQIGPMVSKSERARVLGLIADTKRAGATMCLIGQELPGPGAFISPTIVSDVPKHAHIYSNEIFGPMLQIESVTDVEEGLALANSLPFGLTASVWTSDIERGAKIARRLQAGTRVVNLPAGSMVEFPWGGRRKSGIGRMLSVEGMRKFSEPVTLRLPLT